VSLALFAAACGSDNGSSGGASSGSASNEQGEGNAITAGKKGGV
jgi:hypothetical protein